MKAKSVRHLSQAARNRPGSLPRTGLRFFRPIAFFLKSQQTVAISDIDTRMLTRYLRENGTQNATIESVPHGFEVTEAFIKNAI
ncbi:MAG: hypothetical protein EBX72_08110, partial [Betaproteobacteria bacterium]|nr:hypothetical protein [Betaproteobacteria bacterium]